MPTLYNPSPDAVRTFAAVTIYPQDTAEISDDEVTQDLIDAINAGTIQLHDGTLPTSSNTLTRSTLTAVALVDGATPNLEIQDSSATFTRAQFRVFAKTMLDVLEQNRADLDQMNARLNLVSSEIAALNNLTMRA